MSVPSRGDIEVFHPPAGTVEQPTGIIADEDGGIWLTSLGSDRVGRIEPRAESPAATIETFGAPPEVEAPFDIKAGRDGWLWFTNQRGNSLGRIYTAR